MGTLLAFAIVSVSILILRFVPPEDIIISSASPTSLCFPSNMDSEQDGTICPLLGEDQEQQVDSCESTTQLDKEEGFSSKLAIILMENQLEISHTDFLFHGL